MSLKTNKGVTFFGRTLEKEGITWFDWTCSGFQFAFEAGLVEMEYAAFIGEENGEILTPFIGVFLDDMETPYKIIELTEESGKCVLYEGDKKIHHMRVLKRTEARLTGVGLKRLWTEEGSSIKALPMQETLRMEFIGDSVTCGYGNENACPEDGFKTRQENGWESFAAKTARKMKAQFQMVSVSGIGLYSSYTDGDVINDTMLMGKIYGSTSYFRNTDQAWDFNSYRPDIIVICLGTNDFSYVQHDFDGRVLCFGRSYLDFLMQVREKNGTEPYILCCLGIMGEELNGMLEETVETYRTQTGDRRIKALALSRQLKEDGEGGSFHPTQITHEKMANRVCEALKSWIPQDMYAL